MSDFGVILSFRDGMYVEEEPIYHWITSFHKKKILIFRYQFCVNLSAGSTISKVKWEKNTVCKFYWGDPPPIPPCQVRAHTHTHCQLFFRRATPSHKRPNYTCGLFAICNNIFLIINHWRLFSLLRKALQNG